MEAAISKTPILSTDVGVASEILHKDSIFEIDSFSKSFHIEHAYKNSLNYTIPKGLNKLILFLVRFMKEHRFEDCKRAMGRWKSIRNKLIKLPYRKRP